MPTRKRGGSAPPFARSRGTAACKPGLVAEVLDRAPLPFETAGALRFPDQAQFNPARYLVGLAASTVTHGGRIFENTRVTKVRKGPAGVRWRVEAGRHRLDADHVVLATNLPIDGPIPYDLYTQPRCHYAMAFRAGSPGLIDGMFIDVDQPAHSLRMGSDSDGPLLVALGPRFDTGHEGDVAARFRELEGWVRERFDVGRRRLALGERGLRFARSGALCRRAREKGAGPLRRYRFQCLGRQQRHRCGDAGGRPDEGRASSFVALYDPAAARAKRLQRGRRHPIEGTPDVAAIAPGEGGVIKRGRQTIAVWKSTEGKLHALDASCTHKGCIVTWNNADRTWDCPCHGSMFTCEGAVIHGPATEPLKRVRLPAAK